MLGEWGVRDFVEYAPINRGTASADILVVKFSPQVRRRCSVPDTPRLRGRALNPPAPEPLFWKRTASMV